VDRVRDGDETAALTGAPFEHVCEMYHTNWVYAYGPNQEAAMTDRCIHGFEAQHCASCRRCPHGLAESRCATCNPRTAREAVLRLANEAPRPAEEHRGYEITYVARERSWYIRADADAPRSGFSYRSAFQARRAVDEILDRPSPVAASGRKKRG
jgi:hypothetical protein